MAFTANELLPILVSLLGIASVWGALNSKVKRNCEDIAKLTSAIDEMRRQFVASQDRMRDEISPIRERLSRMEGKIDQLLDKKEG